MSWQCPYCETVNQDAVPVCTVCDRIAPVIESFLSLEEIEHAREYAETLSEINRHESSGEYNKMLESALKAIASYQQNDIAVNKAQLAIKLDFQTKIKKQLLAIIDKSISEENFLLAVTSIQIWKTLKFDTETIKDKKDLVQTRFDEQKFMKKVNYDVTEALLMGDFNKGLEIIDKSLLKYPENKPLTELRNKMQSGISLKNEHTKKLAKPFKKQLLSVERPKTTTPTMAAEKKSLPTPQTRKFPKVKRNNNT